MSSKVMEPQSSSSNHSGCFDSVFLGLQQPSPTTSVVENASSSSSTIWSMTTDNQHAPTDTRVVRLRGLPYSADSDAVRAFFTPIELAEVYFCRRDGRPTGEAYVTLAASTDSQACCTQLDKKYIGSRYIELFEASAADLRAVKKVLEYRSLQGFVVRLRGLPYSATEADVRDFMNGVQLSRNPDCIVFAHAPNGRPTGEAYVELANEEALTLAMTRHKEVMGTRYIEVFNSSKMDKLQVQKQLEELSSPVLDNNRRWLPTVMLHSSACVGHGGQPPASGGAIMQQAVYPMRQPMQPVVMHCMQPYPDSAAAGSLADKLGAQCSIPPGYGNILGPTSGAMSASNGLRADVHDSRSLSDSQGASAAVSTAAYPPPGLQLVHVSQPGLIQQQHAMMVPISSSSQGLTAVAAACAGLNPAGIQVGRHVPQQLAQTLPGLQGMGPAGFSDRLACAPACGYLPAQQGQSPLLLQDPSALMPVAQPGLNGFGTTQDLKYLQQQLPYVSGPMGPIISLPVMTVGAPAAQQHLQQVQQVLPTWGPVGSQALAPDSRMGWAPY